MTDAMPQTEAGRALLERESLNSRSFALIRREDIVAIEREAFAIAEIAAILDHSSASLRSTSRDSEVREAIEALRWYDEPDDPEMHDGWQKHEDVIDAVLAILDRSSAGIVQPRPEAANGGNDADRPTAVREDRDGLPAGADPAANYSYEPDDDTEGGYLAAIASEAAPVVELSEAWAKAEAALPDEWSLWWVQNDRHIGEGWNATAGWNGAKNPAEAKVTTGEGPTPTDALTDLAARLTQTRTLGEAG